MLAYKFNDHGAFCQISIMTDDEEAIRRISQIVNEDIAEAHLIDSVDCQWSAEEIMRRD